MHTFRPCSREAQFCAKRAFWTLVLSHRLPVASRRSIYYGRSQSRTVATPQRRNTHAVPSLAGIFSRARAERRARRAFRGVASRDGRRGGTRRPATTAVQPRCVSDRRRRRERRSEIFVSQRLRHFSSRDDDVIATTPRLRRGYSEGTIVTLSRRVRGTVADYHCSQDSGQQVPGAPRQALQGRSRQGCHHASAAWRSEDFRIGRGVAASAL